MCADIFLVGNGCSVLLQEGIGCRLSHSNVGVSSSSIVLCVLGNACVFLCAQAAAKSVIAVLHQKLLAVCFKQGSGLYVGFMRNFLGSFMSSTEMVITEMVESILLRLGVGSGVLFLLLTCT